MESHSMITDWQIFYLEGNTPQTDLQFQCSPYQNHSWLLCRNSQADSKICVEIQGTQNHQTILKKNKVWQFPISELTKNDSNQDSEVLINIDLGVNRMKIRDKLSHF